MTKLHFQLEQMYLYALSVPTIKKTTGERQAEKHCNRFILEQDRDSIVGFFFPFLFIPIFSYFSNFQTFNIWQVYALLVFSSSDVTKSAASRVPSHPK